MILHHLRALVADRGGSVVTIAAVGMPLLLGAAGLGVEVSYLLMTKRAMQNAADSAAIAASANGGPTYESEARAVAAQYGFTNGVKNVTVAATNTAACPTGESNCYRVTITGSVPMALSRALGLSGTVLVNGTSQKGLSATSTAGPTIRYCVLTLDTVGTDFESNGAPKANMQCCNVMSNSSATCNGHNLGADIGSAHLTNNGCGVVQKSGVPIVPDPYRRLAAQIPASPCTTYPQAPQGKNDAPLPESNKWQPGSRNLSGTTFICGDLQLAGDVTINAPDAVLVIKNGKLDTNGFILRTLPGSALTVIFTGDGSAGYSHIPTGGGTLDITAPTSGTWSGVALYQDPSLTSGVNISAAGNSPAWKITGLVYVPNASVTFSGAVNKSSNGQSCFGLVAFSIRVNGTGSILTSGSCPAAGLNLPASPGLLVN